MLALITIGSTRLVAAQSTERPIADEMQMAPRVYGVGAMGVGGDVFVHGSAIRERAGASPGGGAALGVEVPLGHPFSLGAEGNVWVWGAEHTEGMNVSGSYLLELSAVPRFRCPWSSASGEQHFSLGVALPVGPTISILHSGDGTNALSSIGTRDGTGRGLHLGALAEAQVFVIPRVGLLFDVGYIHHITWYDPITLGERALQIDFGQLVVRLGLIVAL